MSTALPQHHVCTAATSDMPRVYLPAAMVATLTLCHRFIWCDKSPSDGSCGQLALLQAPTALCRCQGPDHRQLLRCIMTSASDATAGTCPWD